MKYIQLDPREEIAIIRINRQEALNAMNIDVIAELSTTIDIVGADDGIKAIILTGAGENFERLTDRFDLKLENWLET
jgi:3-hydroxypropionyl-coenzyme A dehydratase